MDTRHRGVLLGSLIVALTACAPGADPPPATSMTTVVDQSRDVEDMWALPSLQPVEPGTYFIDPDFDQSTPLRVIYVVPEEGWSQWAGTFKPAATGSHGEEGHVGVSITTVNNLVSDACRDHSHQDPPVGPSVDDLATALAELAPFQVTSPPEDVTAYGFSGKHLELTVPDLPVEEFGGSLRFAECIGGQLKSWVAPFDETPDDAFYGYTGPGYTEEFWILDVEGTRLMIAAEASSGSPEEDLDERRTILESIVIEP